MIGEDWGHGNAWCPTHRTWVYLADEYLTDDGGDRPVERVARPLQCGHNADDGGALPSRRQQTTDPGLVDRVVALQAGAARVVRRAAS